MALAWRARWRGAKAPSVLLLLQPRAAGGSGNRLIRVIRPRSAFPALRARAEGGDTVLTGVPADQAALYGVLAEAEALGLELIDVRRLPPGEPREPPP